MINDLTRSEVSTFICEHENEDPAVLMLRAHRFPDLPMSLIASQIASRQKARTKLPNWYNTDGILFPPKTNLEQCSDERVAQYRARYAKGDSLLDLSAGTGVDLFFMGKNKDQIIAVEPNSELTALLAHNMKVLGKDIQLFEATAESFLEQYDGTVDLIFIDPSRRNAKNEKQYQLEDSMPSVPDLLPLIMKRTRHLIVKASPMIHIKEAINKLRFVSMVEVISLNNEVKEVSMHLKNDHTDFPLIRATDITPDGESQSISFFQEEEAEAVVEYGEPETYLYDPMAPMRKAGGFKIISARYGLKKLHTNTHLYTSDKHVDQFPGRVFRVVDTFRTTRKELRKRIPDGEVNFVARNFPMTTNQVKQKYGLKDGGRQMLFLTQSKNRGRIGILCESL